MGCRELMEVLRWGRRECLLLEIMGLCIFLALRRNLGWVGLPWCCADSLVSLSLISLYVRVPLLWGG